MEILFDEKLVGTLENTVTDMWYIEGDWMPGKTEVGKNFDKNFRQLNLQSNFTELKGVLIDWVDDGKKFKGLALGIKENTFVFRSLSIEAVEILKKENKFISF